MTHARYCSSRIVPVLALCYAVAVVPAIGAEYRFSQSEASLTKDDPAPASGFQTGSLGVALPVIDYVELDDASSTTRARCAAWAGKDSEGFKGARIGLRFELSNADGDLILQTNETLRTRANGFTDPVVIDDIFVPSPDPLIFTALANPLGGNEIDEARLQCFTGVAMECAGDACIDDRFLISVFGANQQAVPPGGRVGDDGLFFFFAPDDIDLVVRVFDECATFQRFWAFYGGRTDVDVRVVVADTQTGASKQYFIPGTGPVASTFDENALNTCP